jgi:hypothetical protein
MSSEDALQQCGVVFARCLRLYNRRSAQSGWGRVDNAAWFMALFKRALANEFNTLSRNIGRSHRAELEAAAEMRQRPGTRVERNPGPLLAGLSDELRQVLRVLAVAPSEFLQMLLREPDDESWAQRLYQFCSRYPNSSPEFLGMLLREQDDKTWSRRLCRLCGIYPNETIVEELRDLAKREAT